MKEIAPTGSGEGGTRPCRPPSPTLDPPMYSYHKAYWFNKAIWQYSDYPTIVIHSDRPITSIVAHTIDLCPFSRLSNFSDNQGH